MKIVYTVGHSTRPIGEFIGMLKAHQIEMLLDVRTIPGSSRHPQFNKDDLKESLLEQSIEYLHMPGLGGLRHTTKASINTGWRNSSFRGYADYMQTPEFSESVDRLIKVAAEKRTAIMCAEAVPWRCHRSLVADALTVRGVQVEHIMNEKTIKPHTMTRFAKVEGMTITYPEA